jgi:hypothetical protein
MGSVVSVVVSVVVPVVMPLVVPVVAGPVVVGVVTAGRDGGSSVAAVTVTRSGGHRGQLSHGGGRGAGRHREQESHDGGGELERCPDRVLHGSSFDAEASSSTPLSMTRGAPAPGSTQRRPGR